MRLLYYFSIMRVCSSTSLLFYSCTSWDSGRRVKEGRLDEQKLQKKIAFKKTEPILGTLSVPNPGTRLVPRLVAVRFACSISK